MRGDINHPHHPDYDTRIDEQREEEHHEFIKGLNSFVVVDVEANEYPEFESAFIESCKDSYGNELDYNDIIKLNEEERDVVLKQAIIFFNEAQQQGVFKK